MWIAHPDFGWILRESWLGTVSVSNFDDKVAICGAELAQWANKEFGSIRKRKMELTEKLQECQKRDDQLHMQQQVQQIEKELDQVLKAEETMWFHRSRALWLKDGDRNSSFFHYKASMRKRRNTIKTIKDADGIEVTKKEEIMKVVRDYFVRIFSRDEGGEMDNGLNTLDCKVTQDMNDQLMRPYTVEEVIKALKQMHPAKAPGPDGMTRFFFQKYWSIIKSDVLHTVLGILNHNLDPSSLNHTHIVLIPKVKTHVSPMDVRPISLCNVVVRVLTKTIANRLKVFLHDVISNSQSAFIPGRMITDNAMIAFETFHSMKMKKRQERLHGYEA